MQIHQRIASTIPPGAGVTLNAAKKLLLIAIGAAFLFASYASCLIVEDLHAAQLLHAMNGPLPSFEVATIKPGHSDDTLAIKITRTGLNIRNASLTDLIRFAYRVKSDVQLPKGPHWIDSDRFDIDARIAESQTEAMQKLPPDERFEQYRLMVQSLLADRFALKLISQMKDLPVYALVLAKDGPKLKEVEGLPLPKPGHTPPPPPAGSTPATTRMPGLSGARGHLKAMAVSMPFFTDWVSRQPESGERVVIDATGLKGSYDFELNWSPDDGHTQLLNGEPVEPTGPSFFTALQEQIGLKLESQKAPVEVLVLDHVEHPSEN